MEERFETVEGTAQFLSGRKWHDTPAGEGVVVPPGTRHAFRNRSDDVAHIRCRATPPMTPPGVPHRRRRDEPGRAS